MAFQEVGDPLANKGIVARRGEGRHGLRCDRAETVLACCIKRCRIGVIELRMTLETDSGTICIMETRIGREVRPRDHFGARRRGDNLVL